MNPGLASGRAMDAAGALGAALMALILHGLWLFCGCMADGLVEGCERIGMAHGGSGSQTSTFDLQNIHGVRQTCREQSAWQVWRTRGSWAPFKGECEVRAMALRERKGES